MAKPPPRAQDATVHFDMPRRRREPRAAVMSVNLTPAIDITFNLLIFFVVATTFKAAEGLLPSNVPRDQGLLEAVPLPISPLRVRLRETGEGPSDYHLTVDNLRPNPDSFLDLTALLEALLDRPGFDADTPVVILPDSDVSWDHVVNCYNAIRRVHLHLPDRPGFKTITFAAGR